MRDPHVQQLLYSVSSDEGISYSNPEPLSFSNHFGSFRLADGQLLVVPAEHFASEGEVREVLEPYLKAWEIESDLTGNLGRIRFKFLRVEIIERAPSPEGSHIIHANFGSIAIISTKLTMELVCKKYPDPPKSFYSSSDVQLAHHRWVQYRSGREPLPSMAYYVFTLARTMANGCDPAGFFQISNRVINKISELSSTRGNESTARKAGLTPFSPVEEQWLEEAIRRLILRIAENASGRSVELISMDDLPPLT